MSADSEDTSEWYRETMSRLYDAEVVVDFQPVGPRDRPMAPDFISVELLRGFDSEVLNGILGYENYVILSAYVGESGDLIVDITDPKRLDLFKGVL